MRTRPGGKRSRLGASSTSTATERSPMTESSYDRTRSHSTSGGDRGHGKKGHHQPVLMPSQVSSRVGFFDRFAGWAALIASRATFFAFCVLLIVIWAPTYFVLGSLDTWQ